jgi:hypothetical protein
MTPEAKVKKKVKDVLNDIGAYYTMPVTGGYGNSGAPDFIICIAGLFYGIECKANGGKPTALQLKNHDDIRKAGGIALVIDETNVDNLRKELISHVEERTNSQVVVARQNDRADSKGSKSKAAVRVLHSLDE